MQYRRGKQTDPVWRLRAERQFNSFIVSDEVLLAAGHTGADGAKTSFLAAIDLQDGRDLWREDLAGPVVKGGTAVNHQRQIFVSLENGQILAFAAKN